jgi:hypothetical protein
MSRKLRFLMAFCIATAAVAFAGTDSARADHRHRGGSWSRPYCGYSARSYCAPRKNSYRIRDERHCGPSFRSSCHNNRNWGKSWGNNWSDRRNRRHCD